MHRCLALASLGRSKVGNGAMVGAVLVRGDQIVAEGYHRGYGAAHAERALLEGYVGTIEPTDVLYVNLEPCCHHGKTPPCTDIILERGIKKVIYGMRDPDSRVAGKGVEALSERGIKVVGPLEREKCEYFNKGYISIRTKSRPWITLKMAKDRADRISNDDGSPLKITSQEQNEWSHNFLRARHDAICVGIGTIISDNPSLNRRFIQNGEFSHSEGLNRKIHIEENSYQPYRIVLDPHCSIPLSAKVICDDTAARTIVCVTPKALEANPEKKAEFDQRGVTVLAVPHIDDHFDWPILWQSLMNPNDGFHGLTSILVEGGARTWKAFHDAGVVDEEVILTQG